MVAGNILTDSRVARLSFVIAAFVTLSSPSVLPGQSAAVSVKEALLPLGDGSVAAHVEQPVQLVGTLTSEPVSIADDEVLAFFQDPTGGVSLIADNAPYRMATAEILVKKAERMGSQALPSPIRIDIADVQSGSHVGELVSVAGEILPTRSSSP